MNPRINVGKGVSGAVCRCRASRAIFRRIENSRDACIPAMHSGLGPLHPLPGRDARQLRGSMSQSRCRISASGEADELLLQRMMAASLIDHEAILPGARSQ